MLTYIIALIFIAILLFSAIRLHLSFGLQHEIRARRNAPQVSRPALLRDRIFQDLAE